MYNRFIAIDFETATNDRNSACALGIAVVENLEIIDHDYFLIRPPKRNFVFTDVHGITWNQVKNEATFDKLWPHIRKYFRKIDFIAAHNSAFDKSVMESCCNYYGLKPPKKKYRCTLELSRKKLNLEKNSLDVVCRYYSIDLNHHNALSDTLACAKLMINFMK